MKNFKILTILFVFLFVLTDCANKDFIEESIDFKKIEESFYNPKMNKRYNENENIVFNLELLNSNEMEYLRKQL